jgi:hypothetical protein
MAAAVFSAPAWGEKVPEALKPRKPKFVAFSTEVGMNSLCSVIGPFATVYPNPWMAVDLGAGLSFSGLRPGVRTRFLFSQNKLAYFGGIGLKHGMGSGGRDVEVEDAETREKILIQTQGSTFVDLSLGMDYLRDDGLLFIANAGYSQSLSGNNYSVSNGYTATDRTARIFDTVYGSGLMLSFSLGKAY